ncbi:MAG: glycine--tRNA ligase subunit beta [Gammaproteobacteria bacterium]|nr:glycine--tRNA ligase subunit beta [Gammaproteobacteria bacterium]
MQIKNPAPLLIEIGTEELPPKTLKKLSDSFQSLLCEDLKQAGLNFKEIKPYATPRRLALKVIDLAPYQDDRTTEKRGPSISAAFDEQGKPTRACEGFLRGINAQADQLIQRDNYVWIEKYEVGKSVAELIPSLIADALAKLPIAKRMRWGNGNVEFVRPVHWVVLLYGNETLPANIMGHTAGRNTFGHRFHAPASIALSHPDDYESALEAAYVVPDFEKRQQTIRSHLLAQMQQLNLHIHESDALLDEVTALVEWPVALLCEFNPRFLDVPKEALISAMESHQKSFALLKQNGTLAPYFITISNIESQDSARVIQGNERVMAARLSDAEFFYKTDIKSPLIDYTARLKTVIFQTKLGTIYDKTDRIYKLAMFIAENLDFDATACNHVEHAAKYCKADLMTNMVGEFPELQGIAGYYYALQQNEPESVALAIKEHYLPRFAGDQLPDTVIGCIIAIADRIDTLVGIFGINQAPTGEKDPFGLRRAALGILRIILEKGLNLDLSLLIHKSCQDYGDLLTNNNTKLEVTDFIIGRLYAWYNNKNISTDIINAVINTHAINLNKPINLLDIDARINVVQQFISLPESSALIAANKRVSGILKQEGLLDADAGILKRDHDLLVTEAAEKALDAALESVLKKAETARKNKNYLELLQIWAQLRDPIDVFFDQVMVLVDDPAIKKNRLALLRDIRQLFLYVADVSLLQS